MAVNALPDEVLHLIFRQLYGASVVRCREVCRRWLEAVDCLSDQDWKQICRNDILAKDCAKARVKYGLSWRDTYKALNSWRRIGSYEMSSQELCDGIQNFKVLPKGLVACLQNQRHKTAYGLSDTIVYYNSETFQKCGQEDFKFPFIPHVYDENEYLRVLINSNGDLYIIVKETKEEFIVGNLGTTLNLGYHSKLWEFSLIGNKVYFKDMKDQIIYVSKLKKEKGVSTIKTEPLEAFLENQDSYEETIVAFSIRKGNVNILSDEGQKGKLNIYIHEDADLDWVTRPCYDQYDLFLELQEYGFNWKSPPIYTWLSYTTNLASRPAFYSHGSVYLTTCSYGKTVCIHYIPNQDIFCPDHLLKLFKSKPHRRIKTEELSSDNKHFPVVRMDIIETSTSHKVLVLVANNRLFVLEFTPQNQNRRKLSSCRPAKEKKNMSVRKKKVQQAKKSATKKQVSAKKSIQKEDTKSVKKTLKKAVYTAKNKSEQTGKRSVLGKNKTASNTSPVRHSYATRSSTK